MPRSKQIPKMLQPTFIFLVVFLAWSANGQPDYPAPERAQPPDHGQENKGQDKKGQDENCGIIGSPVEIREAPWLVSVLKNNKPVCSGVIYSEKFILTAAECVKDLAISDLKVRASSANRNEGGSVAPVCKRLIHGQSSKKTYDSNLALLGLCEPLQLSANSEIKEIKEIDQAPGENTEVTAFGWGSSGLWGKLTKRCSAASSLKLRKAVVQVYNLTSCAADRRGWYQPWGKGITELNICTSKPDKLCSYDMGSPLIANERLVGILSKGDCSKKPDIFSSVAHHKNWLKSNTRDEGQSP